MIRPILMFVALLIAALPASAVPINSEASGVYLGSDRVCRVELSRFQVMWIRGDVTCLYFTGALSNSRSILYAPNQCWGNGVAVPFDPQTQGEFVALIGFDVQNIELQIIRGPGQTQVANGIGTAEAWYRIGPVQSPAPFSCGSMVTSRKP